MVSNQTSIMSHVIDWNMKLLIKIQKINKLLSEFPVSARREGLLETYINILIFLVMFLNI